MRFAFLAQYLLVAFLVCAFAASGGQGNPQQQPPTIRVNVNRVNVGVIVSGRDGKFVEGLHQEDFHVFDNGVEQPITGFLPVADPAQVLFLIESGPAVFFLSKSHYRVANELINNLSLDDRVAIASYSKDPELLLDFTPDKSTARLALQSLNFMAGFGELNLSTSLVLAIDWLAKQPGKKSVVVLATGLDTSAPEKWPLVREKLETSDVRILAVSLSGDFRKPIKQKGLTAEERKNRVLVKQGFAEADRWLQELSQTTGGRAYFPKNQKEFNRAYKEIAQLVRHEYSLAFTPPAHDGQLHKIEVKVKGMTRGVDYRQAYLAAAPPGS